MPDPLDKIRDEIARLLGWTPGAGPFAFWTNANNDISVNPVPPSLDWVSENWPKDRPLYLTFSLENEGEPRTWSASSYVERVYGYTTELHARFALLLAVLDAEGTR